MPDPRRQYPKWLDKTMKVVASFNIFLGVILFFIQAVITGINPVDVDVIGTGIWVGVMVIVAGILGILFSIKPHFGLTKKVLMMGTLVLTFVCTSLACYAAVNAILFKWSPNIYYMMEFTYLKIILAVLSCLTALINLIMFITSIIAMCFTKCCPTAPGPTNEQAVGQGDQPLDANPQLEEAFDNLPMYDFNSNRQPQVGNIGEAQMMQATDNHFDNQIYLSVKDGRKEAAAADQLVLLNHFKEKNNKLEIGLANLQGKCDVLNQNFDKYLEIEALGNVTIAECKFRLEELIIENVQLESEVTQWRCTYFSTMQNQQGIADGNPIPPENNHYYFHKPQLISVDHSASRVKDFKEKAGDQSALLKHYKEKSVQLQFEQAKLQLKYNVLNEKFGKFSGIEASRRVTIAECKFRKDELIMNNAQLKSELAQWKGNCLRTQKGIIAEVQRIPRPNNPYYY